MSEATLTIPGDEALDAFVAAPEGSAARAAVLVVHGAFEPNPAMHEVSRRLARQGYIAVAPALPNALERRPHLRNDDLALLVARAKAFAQEQLHPATGKNGHRSQETKGIGILGFGLGGLVAFLAACRGEVAAAVSFYPRGIARPIRGLSVEPLVRDIKLGAAPILGLFGAQDERVRPRDVAQIRARLTACRVPHELIVYPHARQGFILPERSEYRADAAEHAWSRTLTWLDRMGENGHRRPASVPPRGSDHPSSPPPRRD